MKEVIYRQPNFFTWPTLYRDMVNIFPDGSKFAEIGLLEGRSLIYLINEIAKSGKDIKIIGVDYFQKQSEGLLEVFWGNTQDLHDKFELMVGKSAEIAEKIKDGILDFVFIDADHRYEFVKADILAWLPKIKNGGIIAGHDYIPTYSGVMQAADEIFKDKVDKKYTFEGCWLVNL